MMLYSSYPSIDLHGIDRDYAKILVRDFINDQVKLRQKNIVIVHGIGKGIVKTAVHEELKNNKNVKDYKLDNFNIGCTIVTLK
ncbi:MAG: Smr/MutS family protein [Bacilli bacterium]|nr:Smr/MutS family protein [Bacilli bacterium]